MGLDMKYQAMPKNCSLLERSRQDPKLGSLLEFFSSIAKEGVPKSFDKIWHDFSAAVEQTIQFYPGLEFRYLSFGRRWDKLYYLLSEKRRQGHSHPDLHSDMSLVEKAIFGGEALHPDAKTTTGFHIRYLAPTDVYEISNLLAGITNKFLHKHFSPVAMHKGRVYKSRKDEDESEFTYIKQDFENLKAFYIQVAAHKEGVITCLC